MKKSTAIIMAIAILSITMTLGGCASVDGKPITSASGSSSAQMTKSEPTTTSEQTTNSSQTQTGESSDISIKDGEITTTIEETQEFPTSCKIYNLKHRMFSEQELMSLFTSAPKKSDSSTNDYLVYEAGDQYGHISDGNLVFQTQTAGNLLLSAYEDLADNDVDKPEQYISGEEDLDFATRDVVMNNIKDELYNKFGISSDVWYAKDFYAVTKEGVDYFKQKVNRIANESTDESDDHQKDLERAERVNALQSEDFYYITIKFKFDDIPLYTGMIFNYGNDFKDIIFGSNCYLIYTKKGIEFISLYSLKEIDNAFDVYEEALIDFENARELIDDKYDNIIVDGEIEIDDMQLVYLPIPKNDANNAYKNYEARPFYAFYCKQTINYEGTIIVSNSINYFDAVTGKEFGIEKL